MSDTAPNIERAVGAADTQATGAGAARKQDAAKPSRRGAIISGAVTVAVLAAVIIVVAALSPSNEAPPPKIGLETTAPNTTSTQLTAQGEAALEAGDAAAAVTLANQALQADPTNQAARTLLTKATEAKNSGSSSSSSGNSGTSNNGTSGANPDKGFTEKVADMGPLLPKGFKDYFLGSAMVTEMEAQVSGTPVSAKQAAMNVTWTVHEADSKSDAQKFVTVVSKKSFPQDGSSVSVQGAPGYFGTDGTRYATCVYVRGRYVFEVLLTGNDRDPKGLRTVAEEAAKAFADSPAP